MPLFSQHSRKPLSSFSPSSFCKFPLKALRDPTMGNCLRPQSSKKCAYDDGEDWSWATPSPTAVRATEGGYSTKNVGDLSGKITEVKIKISKKQLEQLLSSMEVKELRVDQVMAQLMSHRGRHGYEVNQLQRPWRPALQSIPEVN